MSDYLEHGTGTPDPTVQRLESTLRPLRWRRRPPVWPAAAAVALAAVAAALLLWLFPSQPAPWSTFTASCQGCTWEAGQPLDTTEPARARIADRGELRADAGAKIVRVAQEDGARFRLDRGRVEVSLVAPANWLVIEAPGVEAIDLGCAYALDVDAGGHGVLVVRSGAVALQGTTRTEVLMGSAAATWPSGYTGLPVRLDARRELVEAVDAWDRGDRTDVAPILAAAWPNDAVTVWHLLDRLDDRDRREIVVDRLLELIPPVGAAEREALLDGDDGAMDRLFGTLVGLWEPVEEVRF